MIAKNILDGTVPDALDLVASNLEPCAYPVPARKIPRSTQRVNALYCLIGLMILLDESMYFLRIYSKLKKPIREESVSITEPDLIRPGRTG